MRKLKLRVMEVGEEERDAGTQKSFEIHIKVLPFSLDFNNRTTVVNGFGHICTFK